MDREQFGNVSNLDLVNLTELRTGYMLAFFDVENVAYMHLPFDDVNIFTQC